MGNLAKLKKSHRSSKANLETTGFPISDFKIRKLGALPFFNNQKTCELEIGEVVEVEDSLGFVPKGIYKVTKLQPNLISLSSGERIAAVHPGMINVLRRHLPEPANWEEIMAEQQINNPHAEAGCPDSVKQKEEALARRAKQLATVVVN